MRLVPFNDYVVRAEKFTAENPLGTWKRAFLSTEDPNVIEQMKSMARIAPFSYSGSNARWTWYWTDIPSSFTLKLQADLIWTMKLIVTQSRTKYQPRDTTEGVWQSNRLDNKVDAAIGHGN